MRVVMVNRRVLWDHSTGMWWGNRARLRRRQGGTGGTMVERAAVLGVTGLIDLADWTDVSLTVDIYMSEMMTFKASLLVSRMGSREGGINGYTMNGAGSSNLVSEFSMLDSWFYSGGKGRGRCGWETYRLVKEVI